MRFMIIVKATQDSEAGVMPDEKLLSSMQQFHEELMKSGVLVDAAGLKPSSAGWRVKYAGDRSSVVDGPFAETKELIAGYTIIQVKSRDEAIALSKHFPNPSVDGKSGEIEVRQFFELEDFEQGEAIARFCEMDAALKSPVKKIPEGMHTVTPHLVCAGAADAIGFYKKAFNATEVSRVPGPQGKLMHAMIRIGDSSVMLVDEFPEMGALGPKALNGSPVTTHLYVEDVDAVFARAVDAGAKVILPLADMFWGDRYGKLEDPFGHHWSVATHVRDVSPEEMLQASQNMCG